MTYWNARCVVVHTWDKCKFMPHVTRERAAEGEKDKKHQVGMPAFRINLFAGNFNFTVYGM